MIIEKLHDFNLKDIIVISSLPDMGKVGGIVTEHIKNQIEVKKAIKIILTEKPWVEHKNGIINLPKEEYTISVNEKKSIVIFSGENQPQEPSTVFEMVEFLLSAVSKMGNVKMVISTGGYLPSNKTNGDKVYGIATNERMLELLKSNKIQPLSSEVKSITWFNGLILGQAKAKQIDGIGLFGEILDSESPQYKAASNIIHVIEKILGIKVDTNELDKKNIEVPNEPKKDGPGIG